MVRTHGRLDERSVVLLDLAGEIGYVERALFGVPRSA
jgi:hypothetical protein